MQSFQNVAVGFPAGRAPTSEDGHGTNWVIGPQLCPAKPIGCLLGANELREEPGQVIARTSDAIHGFVRFGFKSHDDLGKFLALASQAEAKTTSRKRLRTSLASPQRQRANDNNSTDALIDRIYDHCTGQALPLIYPGAELYGGDPCGDGGNEVLLGRGAVVLSDPLENPGGRIHPSLMRAAFLLSNVGRLLVRE
eukprot:CAMPEP_0169168300 /NCGR_PEP_ID=MMETSP1015-20121227/60925_1 /TAXON_ID=342587 /ORGANISM="Karlodinium micrum, Strain CCMP2283" /LENGTH=194 /DNA_ID=CAMNT_0009241055 /DNA_START=20 /DNA_END=605 /DNA_ORIENTATION=+